MSNKGIEIPQENVFFCEALLNNCHTLEKLKKREISVLLFTTGSFFFFSLPKRKLQFLVLTKQAQSMQLTMN